MASDHKAGESGEALATDFLLRNLKSRGPSSVQAKGFRATIITILFANKALHRVKKEERRRRQNCQYTQWVVSLLAMRFTNFETIFASTITR